MAPKPLKPCVHRQAHGLRWLCVPDFADHLPALDLRPLRHPPPTGPGEIVKDNKARTVARLAHPAHPTTRAVYAKRVKLKGWKKKTKHLLYPTQARAEWKVSRALRKKGIPTCRALAMAERRAGIFPQEAFLITEEIPHTIPLRTFLEELPNRPRDQRRRRNIGRELASLLARMIDRGIFHKDLHVGNVMINPRARAGKRLYVLDLHRVRLGRVGPRAIAHMLVYLADSTKKLGVGPVARIRFLRDLLGNCSGSTPVLRSTLRSWARKVEKKWQTHHRRHMRSRTRRCLLNSSEFARNKTDRFRIFRRRSYPLADLLRLVDSHRLAMAGDQGKCRAIKKGPRTEISRCPRPQDRAVHIKAYLRRTPAERIKDLLRPRRRARHTWIAHRGFNVRDVPAPPAAALLEARNPLSGRPDYLIVEGNVADDLRELSIIGQSDCRARRQKPLAPAERRQLSRAVGDLFRQLARQHIRHRDMKPSNILARPTESGEYRLELIDLDRASFEVEWKRKHWIKHLAQCNAGLGEQISLLDRMRCLRRCGQGRWPPPERLRIAREVLELSLDRNPQWLR